MAPDTPLRRFRLDVLGLTVDALAIKLGTSKATVSRIERGLQPLTMDLVKRVSAMTPNERARDALVRSLIREAAE